MLSPVFVLRAIQSTSKCFTQFLDQFLVLVELLEGLDVHVGHVGGFSLITMLLVSQDAH